MMITFFFWYPVGIHERGVFETKRNDNETVRTNILFQMVNYTTCCLRSNPPEI